VSQDKRTFSAGKFFRRPATHGHDKEETDTPSSPRKTIVDLGDIQELIPR
jgi:hypothetical protein